MDLSTEWARRIPDAEWATYEKVIDDAQQRRIPFAMGGAFAIAAYTGAWRNTKDLDLYVTPDSREPMIALLSRHGFADYFDVLPYDRWWIYRGYKKENDTIIDIISAAANHRTHVQPWWISGPEVEVRARWLRVLPVEVIVQDKLYIMQRERCDWSDVLNLLYSRGTEIDWERVLKEEGEDSPLLAGVLSVFRWLAPGPARDLPSWLWERVGLKPPPAGDAGEIVRSRVELLDRRPWFGPDREIKRPAA